MELIDQHTKAVMEGCKERARGAGLCFDDETLEYIVTNRDLLVLTPKMMIPTLYDYWVHDVEVLREKGRYALYPSNPYETVINTRPAISFYNDNNPDWLNVMIFYHVLGHIDFFQNNIYYRHTWDYDFAAQALSDKRMIAKLRSEKGRWVDYVIEFARGIDNLVGYHKVLARAAGDPPSGLSPRLDYYFDVFLQRSEAVSVADYIKAVEKYNAAVRRYGRDAEHHFLKAVIQEHPEFEEVYQKHAKSRTPEPQDLLQFLMVRSEFLNKAENRWMLSILEAVRNTALFLQPQIRTKIMNEGWASYWHETLFLQDERIHGHEVDFARVNAGVTALPRVGLNPYAIGMRLFFAVEEMADTGKFSVAYERTRDAALRRRFDRRTGTGKAAIFHVRENFSDFTFINTFVNQEFVDRYQLFVAGRRLNADKSAWEIYIKSRNAEDYRRMLVDSLYHPPHVAIETHENKSGSLYLRHHFEGKPLIKEYIPNTLLGIEYLWGRPVQLETTEAESAGRPPAAMSRPQPPTEDADKRRIQWRRVLYTMENRKLKREVLPAA